ncbi:MAG: sporulation integral membrane protein YlbJ [Firmicutes bacterium]|nr:sporulation integral membrane protein YlbJ [Bacillota bacterium]
MIGRIPHSKGNTYFMAACAVFITVIIVIYPSIAFNASIKGLHLWWEMVFPALLPFFIAVEVLMALGVVHFIGVLLEPLMKPVFDVPGVGAFALAMGLTGGYPIGAKIAANLRKRGLCSQAEAERLAYFTNTADPLFMSGSVAIGMFHLPGLAGLICGAHYISAVILGILLRFHGKSKTHSIPGISYTKGNLLLRAFNELYNARKADGRPIGQVLGDSVRDSISAVILIGGFIMMFSVIINILFASGITGLAEQLLTPVMRLVGIDPELISPITGGLFEITLGIELASKAQAPLLGKLMVSNAIIAWGGLSVFAQVSAMTAGTDIRMRPYLITRLIHALIAAFITIIAVSPYGQGLAGLVAPVFTFKPIGTQLPLYIKTVTLFTRAFKTLAIMVGLSVSIWFFRKYDLPS